MATIRLLHRAREPQRSAEGRLDRCVSRRVLRSRRPFPSRSDELQSVGPDELAPYWFGATASTFALASWSTRSSHRGGARVNAHPPLMPLSSRSESVRRNPHSARAEHAFRSVVPPAGAAASLQPPRRSTRRTHFASGPFDACQPAFHAAIRATLRPLADRPGLPPPAPLVSRVCQPCFRLDRPWAPIPSEASPRSPPRVPLGSRRPPCRFPPRGAAAPRKSAVDAYAPRGAPAPGHTRLAARGLDRVRSQASALFTPPPGRSSLGRFPLRG